VIPHDAWVLARLLSGKSVDGDLEVVSDRFRAIARRLHGLPAEARQTPWNAFLDGQDDQDEINSALAAIDPAEERRDPPERGDEADVEWGPIRLETIPPAEAFPLDVLPEPMARLVTEGAEAIGCPPDFLAVPALVVAGGAIGRSVSLKLKDGYFASACLWAACVGPPSDGKTPGGEVASTAVTRIDDELHDEHRQAMKRWDEEPGQAGSDHKKRARGSSPPKPRRIDVDDITMEALPLILDDNPRGVIRLPDEVTSIMLGMNQFKGGKGNDRPNLLKLWSGKSIKKDRVNHESNIPIRCPHPFLAIVGGLPPDMLGSMVDSSGRADGFLDRWLFAYPDSLPVPGWSKRGVSEEIVSDWCELVGRLWDRPMKIKEGRSVPHVAFFTPEGEVSWITHYDAHSGEMNAPDFPPALRGPWGKLREYAGRLALILACAQHAADPTLDPAAVPHVDPRVVGNAWRLVAYFKVHARRVHQTIALGPGSGGETYKAIVKWIRSGRRTSFSESEVKQARRWIADADLADALKALVRRNAIREAAIKPKTGRPPSTVYLVNPALLDTENP
jgi:hypothetical protein